MSPADLIALANECIPAGIGTNRDWNRFMEAASPNVVAALAHVMVAAKEVDMAEAGVRDGDRGSWTRFNKALISLRNRIADAEREMAR